MPASFLCGVAPSLILLTLFRVIQGACRGAPQPLCQSVLLEAFPAEQRGKAMGFWGLGIVVAPVLGPVMGGWLTDSYILCTSSGSDRRRLCRFRRWRGLAHFDPAGVAGPAKSRRGGNSLGGKRPDYALVDCGFHARGKSVLRLLPGKGVELPARPIRFQMIDSGAAYLHENKNTYWA